MEMIHTRKASFPVVPAMPPIENSTSGGTPLATQKAPFQSIALCSRPPCADAAAVSAETVILPLHMVPPIRPADRPLPHRLSKAVRFREARPSSQQGPAQDERNVVGAAKISNVRWSRDGSKRGSPVCARLHCGGHNAPCAGRSSFSGMVFGRGNPMPDCPCTLCLEEGTTSPCSPSYSWLGSRGRRPSCPSPFS